MCKVVIECNKLYRKSLFNKICYKVKNLHEDEFMAYRMLYNCKKIIYVNNKLYYYFQR